ncbi:MAG: PilZ domain-containing protein [Lawsonibacter sp.]|jgi:hypothetical protein
MQARNKYLILDSRGEPVAHCTSPDELRSPMWRLEIDGGDLNRVLEHEYVSIVGTSERWAAAEGRIVRWEDHVVWVKAVRELRENLRENLRMPVSFSSFLYPITGSWSGRVAIQSHDLSCGGVAFFCQQPLEIGELAQIVIPVTTQPLLLQVKVLRRRPSVQSVPLYAARFEGLLREEENMVREAVFSLQLHHRTEEQR